MKLHFGSPLLLFSLLEDKMGDVKKYNLNVGMKTKLVDLYVVTTHIHDTIIMQNFDVYAMLTVCIIVKILARLQHIFKQYFVPQSINCFMHNEPQKLSILYNIKMQFYILYVRDAIRINI